MITRSVKYKIVIWCGIWFTILLFTIISCDKYDKYETKNAQVIPVVYTNEETNVLTTSATISLTVKNDGFAKLIKSGFYYSAVHNPPTGTDSVEFTTTSSQLRSFTKNLNGLKQSTTYYFIAFATNKYNNKELTGVGAVKNLTTKGLAILTTTGYSGLGSTFVTSGGNITSDGGNTVTDRGICWNTSTGPTISNSRKSSGTTGTGSFSVNITSGSLTPNTKYYLRAYAYTISGYSYGNEISFTTPAACISFSVLHSIAGGVAPVAKSLTYGTVETALTGSYKCWITSNLGADNTAISGADPAETAAGWYWQFNRKQGYKHDGTTRTPSVPTWITPISESTSWTAANDPCTLLLGTGWRIPTYTEWSDADKNGPWNNYADTYSSVLKLHAAGRLSNTTGALLERGTYGYYWSSTQYDLTTGNYLYFGSTSSVVPTTGYDKSYGFTLRCIRD